MDESGNLSEDDEFEISGDHKMAKEYKGATAQANKPWDEAYEVSQDLSVAESVDMKDRVSILCFQLNHKCLCDLSLVFVILR